MDLKCKVNKNLIFRGVPTMNDGEIQIFVNDKPLCYIDLDNFGFDYKSSISKKFKSIIDLIIYDLYSGDELNLMESFEELGLREIKENY